MNYNRIKLVADNLNINYVDICKYADITTTAFGKMIKNRSMKVSVLEKICEKLQVSPCLFFEREITTNMVKESQGKYKVLYEQKEKDNEINNLSSYVKELEQENRELRQLNQYTNEKLHECQQKLIDLLERGK